ncbi:hypothetical protein [Halobacterium sp. R2-5]|uniref:hypothetical protein n=1 Tax=Halobacterium sp. R2-5 TaxID=2715751 RepID=UPI0014237509|nr:hypothetical protein [Halobacterium sp. R2-5]NIC00922.1 hypothetical protein [Halobacterium sp. R2-5]
MFDDSQETLRKMRGDSSANSKTSMRTGRNVVQRNVGLVYLMFMLLMMGGALKFHDAILLAIYGALPFLLDSVLFMDTVPLLGRFLPRATLLIELGLEMGALGVGLSLSAIYAIYRYIGVLRMGIPYYLSKKDWLN